MNLGDLLKATAEKNPQKTALTTQTDSASYEQLERDSTSTAYWLLVALTRLPPGRSHRVVLAELDGNGEASVWVFQSWSDRGSCSCVEEAARNGVRTRAPERGFVRCASQAVAHNHGGDTGAQAASGNS